MNNTEEEDWTKVTDPRLRKRVQNRVSQRKHRNKVRQQQTGSGDANARQYAGDEITNSSASVTDQQLWLTNREPPQFDQASESSLDIYDHLPAIPDSLDGWNAIDSTAIGNLDPGNATSSSLALNSPYCSQWPTDPQHFSHGTQLLDRPSHLAYCDTDVYPSPPTTVNSLSPPKWQPMEGASHEGHRKRSLPLMAPGVPNPFATSGAVAVPQPSTDHWERQTDYQLYSKQPQYSTIDLNVSPSAHHRQYNESTSYQSPTSNLPRQSEDKLGLD
ncbi:MAG: hypothetical protein LQ342_003584 [Letrouitia transgressa]|nr:MAG: hypothetical protein LQ342_003584 [Letrouitia transgressa]